MTPTEELIRELEQERDKLSKLVWGDINRGVITENEQREVLQEEWEFEQMQNNEHPSAFRED